MRAGCALALLAVIASQALAADYALLRRAAPDFALRAAAGGNVRLAEHRGDVVVLSFWSSRCNTCREQLEVLDRLHATYGSAGLVVMGVSVDDDPERAIEFARQQGVSFPMLLDSQKQVSREYRVDNLPMTLFVDRSGNVRSVYRDLRRNAEQTYLRALRPLLDE